MEYQQPHGYMRPPPPPQPPPSAADPYQRPPPPLPPPPSNHPWPYSAPQFQYQPQTQHSHSPPSQWPPPDHSQYPPHPPPPPYPVHQPPPYPAHPHFPPPPHQLPPRPPHLPQSYSQDWGSGNWSHHQSWQYPTPAANNNEDDWAAKARAWAAAKSATDNQPQSQFVPAGRPEEQNHFNDQYSQSTDPQFHDVHAHLAPVSNYHQYPVAYTGDAHVPFAARNGSMTADSAPPFQQEKSPIRPIVHQQEVPSSYSSVAGNDLSDQPLHFAPHFNRDPEVHVQPNYPHASGGPWAPPGPGAAYPPVPPTMPSGPQVDHPIGLPSPASGHSAMFPSGHGFQPTVPMIGAPFGVGGTPHPTAFPGDTFGVSDRPKKASVPNWLREEIIKNKTVITSSAPELQKEDLQSIEDDDNNDKSSRKGNQADSKSIESSSLTEDEDEDEDEDDDEVEVARTAAINKEIKRVLTEVLLKVTDELFDEIATKVLKEDDLSVEVGQDSILPSAPSVLTPKASAKILIPTKMKEIDYDDASEKSTSGAPGDLLGLGSYASDEDDEEIQSSGKPNSKAGSTRPQSSSNNLLEGNLVIENGGSPEGKEEQRNIPEKLETDRKSPVSASSDRSGLAMGSNDKLEAKKLISADNHHSSKKLRGIPEKDLQYGSDTIEKAVERNERPDGNLNNKKYLNDDSQKKNTRDRSDKNDGLENNKNLVKKDRRDSESSKGRVDKKGDEEHRRREERRARTERTENHDNSKEKGKEKAKTDEKVKNNESRKRPSPSDGKEGTTETQGDKRTSRKDNDEKRKDRTDEKRERSRHKGGSESSRHKRHRSSSIGARDRESKDNIVAGRGNDSSDESSDDSKRKSHHSRRRNSPSPRPRKRQVSRSPPHRQHSSKRRHSPYSSLENTRGRRSPSSSRSRSRSRSPIHRRR